MSFAGKRALVMGLGRFGGGLGATRFLLERGARVTVTDWSPAEDLADSLGQLSEAERGAVTWRLGGHRDGDFETADVVVVNPAVNPSNAYVARARAAGARITSEVELFLEEATANLILITGTQGKSSTAHITHGLLAAAGKSGVGLAGNIGRSLLGELDGMGSEDELVIELSSYQLEALATPQPKARVAVITNLLTDHIARHGTRERYHAAKLRIADLLLPDGTLLLPHSAAHLAPSLDCKVMTFADSGQPGADFYIKDKHFCGPAGPLAPVADLLLPGTWQRPNALAALAAASLAGTPAADLHLATIDGLDHRSQELGCFGPNAIRVVDNGVSTTPDSTQAALESITDAPVTLLIGGRSKSMPLDALAAAAEGRAAHVIAFGEAAAEFAAAFQGASYHSEQAANLEAAIARAFEITEPGGVLLFSPAGSSFDAFSNFKQRATAFRRALPRRAPQIQL